MQSIAGQLAFLFLAPWEISSALSAVNAKRYHLWLIDFEQTENVGRNDDRDAGPHIS
jgi:hypothetical protein